MPTYVYEILDARGRPTGRTFEVMQSIREEPLTRHPETGQPVRRAIVVPVLGTALSRRKGMLSNQNLERLGFTKYERKGKGYLERVAGRRGPASLGG